MHKIADHVEAAAGIPFLHIADATADAYAGRDSTSNRRAATPANAILNYLFALIEAEASLACHAVGLDRGIGLLHADQKARDSLALDLMEPIRPDAERYLLDLLTSNTFRARNFHETRTGNCRIRPPLTHRLAETLPTWTTLLAPVAETVARQLAQAAEFAEPVPTPLTQANRRSGRAAHGPRRVSRASVRRGYASARCAAPRSSQQAGSIATTASWRLEHNREGSSRI